LFIANRYEFISVAWEEGTASLEGILRFTVEVGKQ